MLDGELQQQENNNKKEVLTEILPDVQQDSWSPPVQLVTKRAEAEEEKRSHTETITSQGEAPRYSAEQAVLSVVSLSDVVGSLVVVVAVVRGTAAEILHHLLLTKQRGKSPIRLLEVKVAALGSFDGGVIQVNFGELKKVWISSAAAATPAAATGFLLFLWESAFCSNSVLASLPLVGRVFLPSVLPAELRVHPSPVRLTVSDY